ncbi:hypothetical protein D3C76_667480 [compost metagenome]
MRSGLPSFSLECPMSSVSLTASLRLAALALGVAVSIGVQACPQGQSEVCIATCTCIPDPRPIFGTMQEDLGGIAASALQSWIVESRTAALREGSEPIPADIRKQLEPYFDSKVLDVARFKIGSGDQFNIGNAVMQSPDTEAVTLVDVIVFRNLNDAMDNIPLWAHEMTHVQQYQEWGVKEFATRYSHDFNSVEAPAYQMGSRVAQALRAQSAVSGGPVSR